MDQPLTVLLVEDSPKDVAPLTRALATAAGPLFALERRDRFEAALERLAHGDVALVLLDLGAPIDTRLADVITLRERFDLPIVVLTDDRDPSAALAALRAGVQDCLVKPHVDLETLARTLRHAVERHRAAIEMRVRVEHERRTQAMEAVGRLAGSVAHDFNNLLTVISGRGELLQARLALDDPLTRDVTIIQQAAERAVGLTRRLLAFGRRQVLQPQVVDLNPLLSATTPLLHGLLGPGIELRLEPAPDLGPVNVDPLQIEQVLVNLTMNAQDAMGDHGTLTLRTAGVPAGVDASTLAVGTVAGPCVMLTVADTGAGIDRPTRARMFEPFFSTKPRGKGLGLGLAIVAGIVQQSGGAVAVESAVGRTSVHVYLPRAAAAAVARAASGEAPATLRGTETILLVDDEDAVRAVAHELLHGHGYAVLEASGGSDALALAEAHTGRIDLLLTDVAMPGMRGPQLAARMTHLRPETRVLYMSAYFDEAIPEADTIQKPFSPRGLVAKVRALLDRP